MAAAALWLLSAIPPAGAGEAEWKLLHDQAAADLQRGDFEQAGLFARQALDAQGRQIGADKHRRRAEGIRRKASSVQDQKS